MLEPGSTRKEAFILMMAFYPYSSGRFGVKNSI